jgi:hypothetical protein
VADNIFGGGNQSILEIQLSKGEDGANMAVIVVVFFTIYVISAYHY